MTGPRKYVHKPVEVEAFLYDGTNGDAINEWAGAILIYTFGTGAKREVMIYAAAGAGGRRKWVSIHDGTYVVKDQDRFLTLSSGRFEARYRPRAARWPETAQR